MNRNRAFQTAAARRKASPPTFSFDDGEPFKLIHSASIELIADLLETSSRELSSYPGDTAMDRVKERNADLRRVITLFVVGGDQGRWAEQAAELTVQEFITVAEALIEEYTGANPTRPASSPDGSSGTGDSSTPGATPEAPPTPPVSPPTVS